MAERIFLDKDFIGKTFTLRIDSPAYFSGLAKSYYFIGKKNTDLGKIRAVVVNKKNNEKFFNVISPNYPGKQLYFKYRDANFSDLAGQGVRTTEDKGKEDKAEREKETQTFLDKIKTPLLIGGLLYAGTQISKSYISAKHGRKN